MLYLLAILAPPIALLFARKWGQAVISFIICIFALIGLLFLVIPGIVIQLVAIVHALMVVHGKKADERTAKIVRAVAEGKQAA